MCWSIQSSPCFAQTEPQPLPIVVAASDSLLALERTVWETGDSWPRLLTKAFYLAETGHPEAGRLEVERVLNDRSYAQLSDEQLYYLAYFSSLSNDPTGLDVALFHLEQRPTASTDHPMHLLACLNDLEKHDFAAARGALLAHLVQHLHLDSASANEMLQSSIPQKLSRKIRKPSTAKRLSVVPGLGQLYAGYPMPALASLMLVAAGGTYTGLSIQQGLYATSVLTGGFGTLLFWTGGSRNAAFLTKRHNEKIINEAKHHILEMIPFSPSDQY